MTNILFLGDSYTIGEGVPLFENFPSQLIQMLRKAEIPCAAPEILAKTGWTTDELLTHIQSVKLQPVYDYVTLLIGVNNEYRGYSKELFKPGIEDLTKIAIGYCNKKNEGVFILNIPDYSCTPFVKEENKNLVAERIADFNKICEAVAAKFKTQYIDICTLSKKAIAARDYLVEDQLHYSAKAYKEWAGIIYEKIKRNV